jgi:recombination directionality factor gp3-like protein
MIPAAVLGAPRLAEIGHLKLGGKEEQARTSQKGAAWHAPVKFESWVITTRRRDGVNLNPDDALMEALERYNAKSPDHEQGKPRRIPIFLPYNEADLNFYTGLALYAGRKRVCWNDKGGNVATRIVDDRKQPCAPREVPCPCPLLEHLDGKPAACKWHGALRVMLRLPGASMGGFFTFRTTSKNSIRNIMGGMARFQHETGGILAGLPLELVCDSQTVKTPDEKDMNAMIVRLDYPGDPEQFLKETVEVRQRYIERREILGKLGLQEKRLLISFQSDDEDQNAADINDEFQPETTGQTPATAMSAVPLVQTPPPAPGAPPVEEPVAAPRKRGRAPKNAPVEAPPQDAVFTPPQQQPEEPPSAEEPSGAGTLL